MDTAIVPQMKKMLGNLDHWLGQAEEHAKEKSFDADRYPTFRLAPDMFALTGQVQAACDTAKLCASRLSGKDAPKHPDDETTLAELRARVKSVIGFLDGFEAKDFEGADERPVRLPFFPEGKAATGAGYLHEFALPNFYFHVTTAYAILRHNGVQLGKRSYIGSMELIDV